MRRRNASRQPLRPPGTRKHNARCPIRRRTACPRMRRKSRRSERSIQGSNRPRNKPRNRHNNRRSRIVTRHRKSGNRSISGADSRRPTLAINRVSHSARSSRVRPRRRRPGFRQRGGRSIRWPASVSAPTPRQSAGQPERACSSLAGRGQRCAKGPSGSARVSGGFRNEPATRRRSPAGRAGRHRGRSAVPRSAAASQSARRGPTGRWRIATRGADVPARADDPGALRRHARRSGSSPGAAKARWVFAARPPARNRPSGCRTFASGPTGHGGCGDHRGPTRSPGRFRYQPPGPRWLPHRDHADDPPGR
jgi:hypothetical protein